MMENKKSLGNKRLLVVNVFVGNIDDVDVKEYINEVKKNVGLHKFDDLVVVYVPVRDHNRPAIEVIL